MRTAKVMIAVILMFSHIYGMSENTSDYLMAIEKYDLQPLAFTENRGQWDEQVRFKATAGGANIWFTTDGMYYQFIRRIAKEESNPDGLFMLPHGRFDQKTDSFEQLVLKVSFVGTNLTPAVFGKALMEYKCNYFIGNDPNQWHTDVSNYQAIYFEEVYPGIDLKYYGNGKQMEYDFIISPGADYHQIQIHYEGAKSLSVNSSGDLVVETEWGNVIDRKPAAFQMDGSDRQALESRYRITNDNTFSFELNDNYNPDLPIVIDPTLIYSTNLSGSNAVFGKAITVDASGCAYVTGSALPLDLPTVNPYEINKYNFDVFVTKLSSDGDSLIYSTYFGGYDEDHGIDISLEDFGCAYITGWTFSMNFPIVNPYQSYQGDWDVFVTKLSSAGNNLLYSTYLGGSVGDFVLGISVDTFRCAYVAGSTISPDFPIVNPYQTYQGDWDVFIAKLSSTGENLIYSTYLGGSDYDLGYGIALDVHGCAYMTGETMSSDFPAVNPYQTYHGFTDAFVSKLSTSGDYLLYSTYLGGSDYDYGQGIVLDTFGFTYISGGTWSADFPVVNPCQTYQCKEDIFVTKLSGTGNDLIYSTYLGGGSDDVVWDIATDVFECAYVTGFTRSTDFPTVNPFQTDQDIEDAFVTKLSNTGNNLIYSTYLGGHSDDRGLGIALDTFGCAYVIGNTNSDDFPTVNQYLTKQENAGVFVAKLSALNYLCGDINSDNEIDVGDVVYLINYIFISGPSPDPFQAANVNCDDKISLVDIICLIDFIFRDGNAPCDTTGDGIPDC
jgi:hypothetical protein